MLIKLDLPNTWQVVRLEMRNEQIELELADGRVFAVGKENEPSLSFAILDGAPRGRSDSELEEIWQKYAGCAASH